MLATGATDACLLAGRRTVLRAVRFVRAESMVVVVVREDLLCILDKLGYKCDGSGRESVDE